MRIKIVFLALLLSACGGGDDAVPTPPPPPPTQYAVGGTVAGLAQGAVLILADNTSDTLSVKSDGSFVMGTALIAGSSYLVTVASQPSTPLQTCTVANGAGKIAAAPVTNIAVTCVTTQFQVGATVTGLVGPGLVLQDNGADDLAVAADGTVTFPTPVDSGAAYAVTVKTSPNDPLQNCAVTNAAGTISNANVTNVSIVCATSITADNAANFAIAGSRTAEIVLQVASFIGERLTYLAAHLSSQLVEPCSDASNTRQGTATYTFADNDKDGTLSSGDTVTIVTNSCYSGSLSDYPTGTVMLTIGPAPSGTYALGFNAQAQLTSLVVTAGSISGALNATYTDSETTRVVSAHVGTPALVIIGGSGGFLSHDTLTVQSADVSKTADYVAAQYQARLAADVTSVAQKARFQVSTPTPFGGPFMSYYEIYPTSGVEEIASGASLLRLAAVNALENQQPVITLDSDGTGNSTALPLSLAWNGPFSGFPWWEPHAGAVAPTDDPGYAFAMLNEWGMSLMYAIPQQDATNGILGTNLPVTTAFKFFFSAPLDSSRTSFVFEPPSYAVGIPGIPATAVTNGAITTLTAPLQHGSTYQLASMYLYSTLSINPGLFNYENLTTSNNLQADAAPSPAVAAPGQTVTLTSTRSFSTNSTIASYAWTQTSGTSVQLTNAASATAFFAVPANAVNGEALVFQLTITDANGETDAVPVTAFVLTDLSQPFLYFRQQQNAAVGLTPENATLESPLNATVTTAQNQNTFDFGATFASGMGDAFQLVGPYGANLAVGTYGAIPSGASVINDALIGFTCNTPTQTFTISDLSTGSNGTVNRFAADFSESCAGGYYPYVGSVRVNSLLPLP